MSTLTSASSFQTVEAAYLDNASYVEDGSTAKAAAFITACRFLLLMIPAKTAHGRAGSVEYDMTIIRDEMRAAQSWLANANASEEGGGIIFPSFDGLRGYPGGSPTPQGGCC